MPPKRNLRDDAPAPIRQQLNWKKMVRGYVRFTKANANTNKRFAFLNEEKFTFMIYTNWVLGPLKTKKVLELIFYYFRPWDHPENSGIYSQLERRSKNWFLIFLNVYVFWFERDTNNTLS